MRIGPPLQPPTGMPSPFPTTIGGTGDERAAGGFELLLEALRIAELPETDQANRRAAELAPEIGSLPQSFHDARLVVDVSLDLAQASLTVAAPATPGRVEQIVAAVDELLARQGGEPAHIAPHDGPIEIVLPQTPLAAIPQAGPEPEASPKISSASDAPEPVSASAQAELPVQSSPEPHVQTARPAERDTRAVESDTRTAKRNGPARIADAHTPRAADPAPPPALRASANGPARNVARPVPSGGDVARMPVLREAPPLAIALPQPNAQPAAPRAAPPPPQLEGARSATPAPTASANPEHQQARFTAQLLAAEGGLRVMLRLPRLSDAERSELELRLGQLLDSFGHRRRELIIDEIATA